MNKELLFKLYEIHSPSGQEKRMRKFIKRWIWNNCGSVKIEQDMYGNLLCTKGEAETYPCLASHMDQVQEAHSKDFKVVERDGFVFGYSKKSHMQQGLGADDKNGILVCLECLKKYDAIKVAFFVEEEIGCGGSDKVDLDFFKDCRFIIQPDRRGDNDLITTMFCGEVCSDDFIDAIHAEKFGYKEAHGSITDVGTLVENGVGISCLNLSCGYYNAHTDEEITILDELENCLHFVEYIIETCTDVYPFKYLGGYNGKYSGYGYGSYSRGGYGGYSGCGKKATDAVPTFSQLQAYKDAAGKVKSYQPLSRDCHDWYDSEDDDYDYFDVDYDKDYTAMLELLRSDPNLLFGDVETDWAMNFVTRDMDILYGLYEDAKHYLYEDYEERTFDETSEEDVHGDTGLLSTLRRLVS